MSININHHNIDIQHACEKTSIPVDDETLLTWVLSTLPTEYHATHLTLRLVEPDEIQHLNATYRKQDKVTNVLAFPSELPPEINLEYPVLGDIIICPMVLDTESRTRGIPIEAHWAHIVIHGVLHLLGYDHQEELDTQHMQSLEISILAALHFDNPYKDACLE